MTIRVGIAGASGYAGGELLRILALHGAIALAAAPLMSLDAVDVEDLVVVAASGTSGAGRNPSESLMGSEVMGSISSYKTGGMHQHIP